MEQRRHCRSLLYEAHSVNCGMVKAERPNLASVRSGFSPVFRGCETAAAAAGARGVGAAPPVPL